jgi:hypothetical protein
MKSCAVQPRKEYCGAKRWALSSDAAIWTVRTIFDAVWCVRLGKMEFVL